MINAQEWLDKNYPKERRSEIREVHLNEPNLEGELDLGDFTDLGRIYISPQVDERSVLAFNKDKQTKLIFKNKSKGVEIIPLVVQRYINYYYPHKEQRETITELDIRSKNLQGELDLSDFINLKKINCSENKLTFLNVSNCSQLEIIDCSHNQLTKIPLPPNPTNLKRLDLRYNNFSEPKINQYSWCWKCQQPNTSKNWCQPCAEKEWKQLEGQELIKKFIEKQPITEHWQWEKLQWIPHEQFINIEKIGEGGFSKIYKAKWTERKLKSWENKDNKWVVLKSLINSQSITMEFLTEIVNTRLVDYGANIANNPVAHCYGISQDPQTKNYVMVMEYKEGGNLREYLKNKNSELSLERKLWELFYIAEGLKIIHNQNP